MYKIYWIKYSEHNDPMSEGYIGLTSQTIEERFKEHLYNKKNKLLSNRCKKEDVKIICLHDNLSEEEAKILETNYRPLENIGWNINKGGDIPPSKRGIINPKTLLTGDNRTEKQKIAARNHSERMKGNNSSGKRKNKVIHEFYCSNCHKKYVAKGKDSKFCCVKCAAAYRSRDTNYKKKMSELVKKQWELKKNGV